MKRTSLSVAVLFVLSGTNAQFTNDARIEGDVTLRHRCGDEVVPVMKIRNVGTEVMFTCVVETWKNSVQVGSFDWQLAVPASEGQLRQPTFPAVTGVAEGDLIEMRIISVNGVPDQDAVGNVLSFQVLDDVVASPTYLVELRLSTSTNTVVDWFLRDQAGTSVRTGISQVLTPAVDHVEWVELDPMACYSVEVVDADGTGFAGGLLTVHAGAEELVSVDQVAVQAGARPGFRTGLVTAMQERVSSTGAVVHWSLGPHAIQVDAPEKGVLRVVDPAGRVVGAASVQAAGAYRMELADLPAGWYCATFEGASEAVGTQRFVLLDH